MSADDLFLMGDYGDASRSMVNVMPGRATVLLTHIDAKARPQARAGSKLLTPLPRFVICWIACDSSRFV